MDALVGLDLTLTQLRVIFALLESPDPRPIFEIADHVHTSVATAGRAVEHLVRAGLADRWEDPEDRRSKLVRLTERGRGLTEVGRAEIARQIGAFCEALPTHVGDRLLIALREALTCVPPPPTRMPRATAAQAP